MGLFDFFKGRSPEPDSDRILTPRQIAQMLADDYDGPPEGIIFVQEAGKTIMPSDVWMMPFLNVQFSKDPRLGMIYGTGSGCALVRKTALARIQAMHRGGQSVTSCQAFIHALAQLGFTVKQDEMLSLDLLP